MSNLLASVLGTPPTFPTLANNQPSTPGAAASDETDESKAFPTGSTVEPAYDNTSSVSTPSGSADADDDDSSRRPKYAEPALGDSNAENLKGGVVGKEYTKTTLQGAHFPTSSTTDDHPGGDRGMLSSGERSSHSSSSDKPEYAEPALGESNAENLRGGVVGKEYSKTTLQGAHFPTSNPTDDHPGGSPESKRKSAAAPTSGDSKSSSSSETAAGPAFAALALGPEVTVDNLRGGAVGKDYSSTSLQGANFPTSIAGDGHPGGGPTATLTTDRTSLSSTSTKAARDDRNEEITPTPAQAARRADADFAPTSENEPSSTASDASQEKPSVKEKLKAGLNKVMHSKSGKGGEDEAVPEPSYRELYDQTVTSKLDDSTVAERHLTADEVARDAATLRREHGPGASQ